MKFSRNNEIMSETVYVTILIVLLDLLDIIFS